MSLPSGPRRARPSRRRALALALLAAGTLGAAACSESLDGTAGCPELCPQQRADELRDTVIAAVVVDTTIGDFPLTGDLPARLLQVAPGADSVDVRYVVRFDSVPARFFPTTGGDSLPVSRVDSAYLRLRLDTAGTRFTQPITVDLFDVDTALAVDTVGAALAARFRPDRRIGTVTIAPGALTGDSLDVPVSAAAIVGAAGGSGRLRVGVRLGSSAPARLRVVSAITSTGATNTTTGARLQFRALQTDTSGARLTISPASTTPGTQTIARTVLEQTVVARSPRAASGTDLVIGGVPARRTVVRFDVPSRLADSTSLVRATLVLWQRPAAGFAATDTVVLIPQAVYATGAVTDLVRVASFATRGVVASNVFRALDTVAVSPAGSGRVELPLAGLVTSWRTLSGTVQRALVVRSQLEGGQAGEVRFFSNEGPAEFRPRLLLTYLPLNPTNGLP